MFWDRFPIESCCNNIMQCYSRLRSVLLCNLSICFCSKSSRERQSVTVRSYRVSPCVYVCVYVYGMRCQISESGIFAFPLSPIHFQCISICVVCQLNLRFLSMYIMWVFFSFKMAKTYQISYYIRTVENYSLQLTSLVYFFNNQISWNG